MTELVAGLDIVHEQFRLAAGRAALGGARWPPPSGPPSPVGHAIEVRLAAEDPARDFAPGAGPDRPLGHAGRPGRPGRHRRRGRATGSRPTTTTSSPRSWSTPGTGDAAIDRLRRALDETEIAGIQTTLPFHRFVARHAGFRAGDLSIEWVGRALGRPGASGPRHAAGGGRGRGCRAVADGDRRWRSGRRARSRGPPDADRLGGRGQGRRRSTGGPR